MWIRNFVSSSIGSKTLMAVTGLMLSGFVLGHMAGNLLVFAGADVFNAYADGIQSNKLLLWGARSGLIAVFFLHLLLGIRLTIENRRARPVKYAHPSTIQASKASTSMIYTGLLTLFYVFYHLAHFTLHLVNVTEPGLDSQGRNDAYRMVLQGFADPFVAGVYILAILVFWAHLRHGFSSLWQSLGLRHPKYFLLTKVAGPTFATAIAVGFISIPVSVMLGFLKLP